MGMVPASCRSIPAGVPMSVESVISVSPVRVAGDPVPLPLRSRAPEGFALTLGVTWIVLTALRIIGV
jgi:hypothetical protein